MVLQLYKLGTGVNEDAPPPRKRILHDVNLFFIAQFRNKKSDLSNPDKTAGTDTILRYANHYNKGQKDEMNHISLTVRIKNFIY